jgi:M6 family metalloprotease-like protein
MSPKLKSGIALAVGFALSFGGLVSLPVAGANLPGKPLTATPGSQLSELGLCRIQTGPSENFVTRSGFPQHPDYVLTKSRPVIQLLYVDASNLEGKGKPAKDAKFWIEGAGGFLNDMAQGKLKFEWRFTKSYSRLARPIESYGLTRNGGGDAAKFVQAAIDASDAKVDFTDVDFVIAVLPPTVTRAQVEYSPAIPLTKQSPFRTDEGLVYRGTLAGADTRWPEGYLLIAHEMGHLLGLQDYYSFEWKPGMTYEEQFKFLGQFDNMNFAPGNSREWTGWTRWLLGFMPDSSVRCVVEQPLTTHRLTAISRNTKKPKIVVIPTGPHSAVVVESRRNTRHDSKATPVSNGLLVYKVDATKRSGFGPIELVKKPSVKDALYADAPLKQGESVTVSGWTIKNTKSGKNWDIAEIRKK